MPRALSLSDGTPPPLIATRVVLPRAAKKRPAADSGSDVEDVPKPLKKATATKKASAKKDMKGKEKAAETENEKKPNNGKGKQKVDTVVDDADEEPTKPQAKRRKTTKTTAAIKNKATRAAKRASPDEEAAPLTLASNTDIPGTPPRKRQRLMDEQPVRRSPRRSAASANRAMAGSFHAPEPTHESPRGLRLGQRRDRAPELPPLFLPPPIPQGILTPSPEPDVREATPIDAMPNEVTPPASARESSLPATLDVLGLSQLHNPIIPWNEIGRGSPTPEVEPRSPSPAPTEIVHHFQPARERPLDEINRDLAEAGIRVRDFAWEGVYHDEWKARAEKAHECRQRERERMEAKTEEWDREEVKVSLPAPRYIGPPPGQNPQAGPSTSPATTQPVVQPAASRALGRASTLNRINSAATFPPGRRALVRQSRPLGRTGTMQSFYQTPGAGPSNAAAGSSTAVAGLSKTARAMTPVREATPVVEDATLAETPNTTPAATPQTSPAAATSTLAPLSRPSTPPPAATRRARVSNETRRTPGSSDSSRRRSGEHSGLPRTPSSLSLVSVL